MKSRRPYKPARSLDSASFQKPQASKTPGFFLTDRDAAALRLLLEQGVSTVNQLWNAVWRSDKSSSSKYAEDRLLRIHRAGYLILERSHILKAGLYRPTLAAYELMVARDGTSYPRPLARLNHNEIEHSLRLTELRLTLQRAGRIRSWKSERVLMMESLLGGGSYHAKRDRYPDAIWHSASGRRILIEVELSEKSNLRLKNKIDRYQSLVGKEYDAVLWLVGHPSIQKSINRLIGSDKTQKTELWSEFLKQFEK